MQTVGVKQQFWRGRRVFVTGHTGFIGGWLCMWLTRMGAQVTGFAIDPPTQPNLYDAARLGNRLPSIYGDVRDLTAISQAIDDAEPEVVFHLAAQPLVRTAFYEPVHTFATNAMGTVNLLEAVRRPDSVRAVIVFTTDKVYDNREWVWGYRETDRLGGREAYGASKAAAELAVDAYRESYLAPREAPIGIATVRSGNVIGGGDWGDERLVPDTMRAFASGKDVWVRAPDAVRPWQHVLDPVRGLLVIAERLFADQHGMSTAWNLGPAEEHTRTVAQIVDELCRLWGDTASWKMDKRAKPYEARLLALNSARAAGAINWRTAWDVQESLARTVEWYRAFYDGGDVAALSDKQIAAHDNAVQSKPQPSAAKRSA